MPVISLYRHGVTGGVPPMKNDHARALRGDVGGWSEGATRRNTQFLYSVQEQELQGTGLAVTLTLRDCPPNSDDWHRLRRAWEARQRRAGMVRLHWVTEWQRRGCPHLHGAIWFEPEAVEREGLHRLKAKMLDDWIVLARSYGAGSRGQQAHVITGVVGWFQYLSKHAARGVKHYQRSSENVPDAWKLRTGRMWGKVGAWPTREKIRLDLQDQHGDGGWFAYRRLVRSWRIADSRGDPARNRSARKMLTCNEQVLSRVRGISEWIPQDLTLSMLANLALRGYSILHTPDAPPRPTAERLEGASTSPADPFEHAQE